MRQVVFSNPYFGKLKISDELQVREYFPGNFVWKSDRNETEIVRTAVESPIGCGVIPNEVKSSDKVLLLIDDNSRSTPVRTILPLVMEQLKLAGVPDAAITILIALGTHRPMTAAEMEARVGPEIFARITVINHEWDNPDSLQHLGTTSAGTDIWVNKLAVEADYIIGIGHIVPHRVAGYSGGGKIIQPGISGPVTTGKTHWLSAYYSAQEVLGNPDNPIRQEIEEVALRVGLKFIVNVVQDSEGNIAGVFAGHPITAHRAGCKFAESIYGVHIARKADIVITEAYPTESELWQATKALQAADIVVKPDGVIILLAACPEGISCSHGPLIEKYGFRPLKDVEALVAEGLMQDLNVSSYLARVGNVLEKTRTILVSKGISTAQGENIGFIGCSDMESAFQKAFSMVNPDPEIVVLHHGSELLPIITK